MNNNGNNYFGVILYESQCSNNCVFCNRKKLGNISENIKKELKKLAIAIKNGETIRKVEISGQDPGEYDKLPEFVSTIKSITHAAEIALFTNGKKLANKNFFKSVISSGVNHFIIPIYGHKAKIHEKITKANGSFAETIKAIKNIYYFQQKISFQSLVTKENQNYLNELFLFLSRLPFFRFSRVGIPCYKKIIGSL